MPYTGLTTIIRTAGMMVKMMLLNTMVKSNSWPYCGPKLPSSASILAAADADLCAKLSMVAVRDLSTFVGRARSLRLAQTREQSREHCKMRGMLHKRNDAAIERLAGASGWVSRGLKG